MMILSLLSLMNVVIDITMVLSMFQMDVFYMLVIKRI